MNTVALDPKSRSLIGEAAEWRLLALLFEYPGEEWGRGVAAVERDVSHPGLRAAAASARTTASEGLYVALFGPGGPVSLREVTYLGGVQLGYVMSELVAYYEAFGYTPETSETPDHLSVEAGFLSYLKIKQAYALVCDDAGAAAIASDAGSRFAADHVACMAEPVLAALVAGAPEYLVLAAQYLFDKVGPRPRSPYPLGGELNEDVEADEMSCGQSEGIDELIQVRP